MSAEKNNHITIETPTREFLETDPLKEDSKEIAEESKRTCKKPCLYVLKNVTVEPTMFLFTLGIMISMSTSQNLNLEKACRVNLNFTTEICDALRAQTLGEQNEYERAVQHLVAQTMTWRTYITVSIPCTLALFVGSWSDKTGHRIFFVVYAVTGQILICINGILNTYLLKQTNLEAFVIFESILEGLTGSWCIILSTLYSYISAITTDKNRTFRMGLLNFSLTVGFPVGMGISGILLRKFGFYGCYGLAAGLHSINVIYMIFVVEDPKRTSDQKMHDKRGALHFFRTFFDLKNVKETLAVVFKQGPNNRRMRIFCLLFVVSILYGPMHGELAIVYISTRYRFNWDEVRFSLFQAYNFVTHTIGTILSVSVFSQYLQWHDSVLGILSSVSKICGSMFYCFAPNERIFSIAPLVDIFNGTALLALRSIVSKLVEPTEFGKVNSIFALTENLMPLLFVPLYTQVYVATMEVLPGAVFLVGSAMTIPAIIVFIWLLWEYRKKEKCIELKEL